MSAAGRTGMAGRLVVALTVAILTVATTAAQANVASEMPTSPNELGSGGLLWKMATGYRSATRLNTEVDIAVNGLVARVLVRQSFRNSGTDWVEGIYVFPLPDDAAVDHMRLRIGERFIEGEIREKAQARKEYEAAKKAGKKASLVDQQRANLFTTAVANVAPGETIVIEIEYQQTVSLDDGLFSLRFPLTMTPRYIPGSAVADRKGSGWSADTDQVDDASLITPPVVASAKDHRVELRASVDAGAPLQFLVSRYHPIVVAEKNGRYKLEFADADVPMDHDVELTWRLQPGSEARTLVFSEVLEGERHVLLMMMPPDDARTPAAPMPRETVFVIDTSGSMHGTSIEQARKALLLALDGLGPSDLFNVIQFNSVTQALFSGTVDASPSNVATAKRYVQRLAANGGTEMMPALAMALDGGGSELHLKQIVFITDGSVGNEAAMFQMIDQRLGATRLFTVGIGSAPNSWFMRKSAELGRGSFTIISAVHEVDEKMTRLFRKLEQPRVTGIEVAWPGGDGVTAYPATVPDLYAGEPVVVRARLPSGVSTGDVVVSGTNAFGPFSRSVPLGDPGAVGIATLWARARIADLSDRMRRGENPDEMRKAIVDTALAHHLVSKYTSLVAVDKTPVRPSAATLKADNVPSLLPHGQSMQAIFGMASTATSAPLNRLIGYCALALALSLLWFRRRHALAV